MNENENVVRPEFTEIIDVNNDIELVKKNVNDERNNFVDTHTKILKKNKIMCGICFALVIGLVVLGMIVENLVGLCIGLSCAVAVVLWVLTRKLRSNADDSVANYLYVKSLNENSYLYKREGFENIKIGYKQKPDPEIIKQINISDEVCVINSRNVIQGSMLGNSFEAADAAIRVGNPNKPSEQKVVFVGKIYVFNYSFKDEGRTFIYLKGCGDAAPTKVADVNKVEVKGLKNDWEVYTSHKEYQKIFSEDLLKVLNKMKTDETLNDIVISIVSDKVLVGFSYSDEAMVIPMNKDFEVNCLDHMYKDIDNLLEINQSLIENSNFAK